MNNTTSSLTQWNVEETKPYMINNYLRLNGYKQNKYALVTTDDSDKAVWTIFVNNLVRASEY